MPINCTAIVWYGRRQRRLMSMTWWEIVATYLVGGLEHWFNMGQWWLIMVNNHWLVVWNMTFIFPYIGNFIIRNWRPHIFQRGRYTTNQIWFYDCFRPWKNMNKEYFLCYLKWKLLWSCFLNVVLFIDIGSYHYQTMRIVIQNVMIPVEMGQKTSECRQLKYHRRP